MDCVFYCIFVVFCCLRLFLSVFNDDIGDFIDEKGKVLNNFKGKIFFFFVLGV